jgi:hypothetical protein
MTALRFRKAEIPGAGISVVAFVIGSAGGPDVHALGAQGLEDQAEGHGVALSVPVGVDIGFEQILQQVADESLRVGIGRQQDQVVGTGAGRLEQRDRLVGTHGAAGQASGPDGRDVPARRPTRASIWAPKTVTETP